MVLTQMWTASDDKYSEAWCYKGHSDEVLALSMHPSGEIFFLSQR